MVVSEQPLGVYLKNEFTMKNILMVGIICCTTFLLCALLPDPTWKEFLDSPELGDLAMALLPWVLFVIFIMMSILMVKWAKRRRSSAYVFGAVVQMLLPDPYVERTIKLVQEDKQTVKKQQEDDGDLK